jgi:hypothetical protein
MNIYARAYPPTPGGKGGMTGFSHVFEKRVRGKTVNRGGLNGGMAPSLMEMAVVTNEPPRRPDGAPHRDELVTAATAV